MFIIKKILSCLLDPLTICLALIVVGLALVWFSRRQHAGKVVATVGTALLLVLCFGVSARLAMSPLQGGLHPVLVAGVDDPADARARQARWIVVLGGGHAAIPSLPPTSQLQANTLARLVEGVRLKRQLPDAKLVFSGAFGHGGVTHAQVVAAAAEILGVPRQDMVLEQRTMDTVDEARLIGARVGSDPFILISSASHLPRAIRLFRKAGHDPIPSPADYVAPDAPGWDVGSFFPSAHYLAAVEHASHEYLGMFFALLRGQI